MSFTDASMCFAGGVLLVCTLLSCGCETPAADLHAADAGSAVFEDAAADPYRPETADIAVVIGREPVVDRMLEQRWAPRAHPPGTLLEDRHGDPWIVVNWLERMRTTHDGITAGRFYLMPPIRMTPEEERCLVPVDKFWDTPPADWVGVYGPDYEIYALDWEHRWRRPANLDTLASWDRERTVRLFPDGDDVWNQFVDVPERLPFRTGSLLRTEEGISYFVDGERWLFESEALAAEAGYDLDRIRSVSDDDVALSPAYGTLSQEFFSICPAESPLAERHDRDEDGSPFHLDCDDMDSDRSPAHVEVCDGLDNDCNGMTDELRGC